MKLISELSDKNIDDWVAKAACEYTRRRHMAEDEFEDWKECLKITRAALADRAEVLR